MHLLNHNESVYEVVISRLRYIFIELEIQLRIIAMSVSTANSRDVCDWLGVDENCIFNFHPNVRPIGLDIYIYGFDHYNPKSRFHSMTRNLYRNINIHTSREPILLFVSDRKAARLTAADLYSYARCEGNEEKFLHLEEEIYGDKFRKLVDYVKDKYLNFYLPKGIGFIYDGMNPEYTKIILDLFNKNIIQVLIITHNLTWSIDVKAHLVVILDTKYYDGHEKRYVDYTIPEIHEMLSKSGIPRKDVSSKCLLFCYTPKKESLRKF